MRFRPVTRALHHSQMLLKKRWKFRRKMSMSCLGRFQLDCLHRNPSQQSSSDRTAMEATYTGARLCQLTTDDLPSGCLTTFNELRCPEPRKAPLVIVQSRSTRGCHDALLLGLIEELAGRAVCTTAPSTAACGILVGTALTTDGTLGDKVSREASSALPSNVH